MKNAELRTEIEAKIATKIIEIVKELKVDGNAISKSIADSAKKIAKQIAKKLKNIEKKKAAIKKVHSIVIKKDPVKIIKPKTEKPIVKIPTVVASKPAKIILKKPETPTINIAKPQIKPTAIKKIAAVKKATPAIKVIPKKNE